MQNTGTTNYNDICGIVICFDKEFQVVNKFCKNRKIILASASPRRKELLAQVGFEFDIVTSNCEELTTKTKPSEVVEELSFLKAADVAKKLDKSENRLLIIGSDTVVALGDTIMGKPKDKEDAFRMLKSLQGREHSVITGVTMIFTEPDGKEKTIIFSKETKVWFYSMNDDEIRAYIDTNEPMDKAGAYAIQGLCAAYIERIEGDYNTVVGLPVAEICRVLREYKEA